MARDVNSSDYYVYVKFLPWDGTPCYVGKGFGNRAYVHEARAKAGTHNNRHLVRIISKAGGALPTIIIRSGLTNDEAINIEMAFIRAIGRFPVGPLANMTDGGEGSVGFKHSDEAKEKVRVANTGRKHGPEFSAAISKLHKGRKWKPETLERRRISGKIAASNRDYVGPANGFYGRTHSEEWKSERSESCKGRPSAFKGRTHSEDAKEKNRAAHLGKVQSEETKRKRVETRRANAAKKIEQQSIGA